MNAERKIVIYRRQTLPVQIGNIALGGSYPVRLQSMANTPTGDVAASVKQCIRIIQSGADLVRFTVPSIADADAFAAIRRELRDKDFLTPLVADVHFNPDIALKVAEFADKVRINPGNFNDPDKFRLLIQKCKEGGKALRIGVNHGSLSAKIVEKFGDTPEGMAESAMEFLRICKSMDFERVVVSMKSSNVRVMILATRIVSEMMEKEGMKYPLHLGVTEAGAGEDGRIKSAVGIGTLLCEGLGDTIRVSLTEDPECEIPVARKLVEFAVCGVENTVDHKTSNNLFPKVYVRRKSKTVGIIGGNNVPVVMGLDHIPSHLNFIQQSGFPISDTIIKEIQTKPDSVLVYTPVSRNVFAELAALRVHLNTMKWDVPVIFKMHLQESSEEDFMLRAAVSLGGAFIDGFGDGIWLTNKFELENSTVTDTALGILQACRSRMSKTEFISCPSCGRTNFNLLQTLAQIKEATSHLKGLKIGVMGCIVNGPGEMADADYGYVGSARGKVTLYKAKEIVKRNVAEENAVQELISIIKENGDWIERS